MLRAHQAFLRFNYARTDYYLSLDLKAVEKFMFHCYRPKQCRVRNYTHFQSVGPKGKKRTRRVRNYEKLFGFLSESHPWKLGFRSSFRLSLWAHRTMAFQILDVNGVSSWKSLSNSWVSNFFGGVPGKPVISHPEFLHVKIFCWLVFHG